MGLGELSPLHIVLVLAIAMIVIGPGKLPEVGSAIGRSLREFRQAASGDDERQPAVAATAAPFPVIDAAAVPVMAMAPAATAEAPVPAPAIASTPTDPVDHPAGA